MTARNYEKHTLAAEFELAAAAAAAAALVPVGVLWNARFASWFACWPAYVGH
jgi:hypothetical protein